MKDIVLNVLASDFRGASFDDNSKCALARAAKRQFKAKYAFEWVQGIDIGSNGLDGYTEHRHDHYGSADFNADRQLASNAKFSKEVVIRSILLTPSI